MNWSLTDMQARFAQAPADPRVLNELDEELALRRTPGARQLHLQVRDALRALSLPVVRSKAAEVAAQQRQSERNMTRRIAELRERRAAGAQALSVDRPLQPGLLDRIDDVQRRPAAVSTTASARPPLPMTMSPDTAMTPEMACRVLGVPATSSWETLESARRLMVARAHPALLRETPSAERLRVQADAERANAAFAVLAGIRNKNA